MLLIILASWLVLCLLFVLFVCFLWQLCLQSVKVCNIMKWCLPPSPVPLIYVISTPTRVKDWDIWRAMTHPCTHKLQANMSHWLCQRRMDFGNYWWVSGRRTARINGVIVFRLCYITWLKFLFRAVTVTNLCNNNNNNNNNNNDDDDDDDDEGLNKHFSVAEDCC